MELGGTTFLTIPYFISGKSFRIRDIYFYHQLITVSIIYMVFEKKFDNESALVFATLVATSSYFVSTSIFVISSYDASVHTPFHLFLV